MQYKVMGSIVLENLPQVIFQAVYAFALGSITHAVYFAFFASILSIVSTGLSFLIDRDSSDTRHQSYFVELQCRRQGIQTVNTHTRQTRAVGIPAPDMLCETISDGTTSPNDLSLDEKAQILKNRGKTLALSRAMAALFHTSPKCIEIGSTILTKQGSMTHIMHSVHVSELEQYEAQIREGGVDDEVTPLYYIKLMYASLGDEVNQIFRKHFGFGKDFRVQLVDSLRRGRMSTVNASGGDCDDDSEWNGVLKSMASIFDSTKSTSPGTAAIELADVQHNKSTMLQ